MWKKIRKMCLFIFVFDYRRKKETDDTEGDEPSRPAKTKPPKSEPSATAIVVDSPPIQKQKPLKQEVKEETETLRPFDPTDHEATALERGATSTEEDTMAPRPGSPLRPHLGARWTSKHLNTCKHPFMPPPADQVSLASTTSDHEPPQAELALVNLQPRSPAARRHLSDEATQRPRPCPELSTKLELVVTAVSSTATSPHDLQTAAKVSPERPTTPTDVIVHRSEMNMHEQELRRNRDDDMSLFTMPSTISGFSIAPTLDSDTTPEASKTPNAQQIDNKSVSSFEILDMEDDQESISSFEEITMEDIANMQWLEDADRYLCILWFFTAYSLNTVAAILSYTLILDAEINFDGEAVRWKLCKLMQRCPDDQKESPSNSQPSMYHGVKRSSQMASFDPSDRCRKLEAALKKGWKTLQKDLEQDKRQAVATHWRYRDPRSGIYRIGVGTDDSSDQGLMLAGLPIRKWSPEMRQNLQELQ